MTLPDSPNESHFVKRIPRRQNPPRNDLPSVDWWITSRCNLRCDFCYGPKPDKDEKQIRREIAIAIASSSTSAVTFCGGEPLTVRDVMLYAEMQRSYGKRTILNTNGELLLRVQQMNSEFPFDVVGISLDGSTPAIHQAMRGNEADFKSTFEAARWVSAQKTVKLKLATVVSSVNVSDLPRLAGLVRDLQPSVWRLYQYSPRGSWNRGRARHTIPSNAFRTAASHAAAVASPVQVSSSDVDTSRGCLIVDPSGKVLLPRYNDYTILGDCLSEAIDKIWKNAPDRQVVQQNKKWLQII